MNDRMIAADKTRELYERDELPPELLWIDDLTPRHQRVFYGELQIEWSRYCLTQDPVPLTEFFEDWQATAEADANPAHAALLLGADGKHEYEDWTPGAAS